MASEAQRLVPGAGLFLEGWAVCRKLCGLLAKSFGGLMQHCGKFSRR